MSTHDEYSSDEEYDEVAESSEYDSSDNENPYEDEEVDEEQDDYGDVPEEDVPADRRDEHEPSEEPRRRKRFVKEKAYPTEDDPYFMGDKDKDKYRTKAQKEEAKQVERLFGITTIGELVKKVNENLSRHGADVVEALGGEATKPHFLWNRITKITGKKPYEVDIYRPLVKENKKHYPLEMDELVNEYYFTMDNSPEQAKKIIERLKDQKEMEVASMRDYVALYNESRKLAKLKKYYESGGRKVKVLEDMKAELQKSLAEEDEEDKETTRKRRERFQLDIVEKMLAGEKISMKWVLDVFKVRDAIEKNREISSGQRKESDMAVGLRDAALAPAQFPESVRDDIYDDVTHEYLVHEKMPQIYRDEEYDVTPESRKAVVKYLTKIIVDLIEKYDRTTEEIPITGLSSTQVDRLKKGLQELDLDGGYDVEYQLYRVNPVRKIVWYSTTDADEYNLIIPDEKYGDYMDLIERYLQTDNIDEVFTMEDLYVSFPNVIPPNLEQEFIEPGVIRTFNGVSSVVLENGTYFVEWIFGDNVYSQEFSGPMAESLAREFVKETSYLKSERLRFVKDRLYKKIIDQEDHGENKGELKAYALEAAKSANDNSPEKILDDLEWTYRAHVIANNEIVSLLREAYYTTHPEEEQSEGEEAEEKEMEGEEAEEKEMEGDKEGKQKEEKRPKKVRMYGMYKKLPEKGLFELEPEMFLDTIVYLYNIPLDLVRYPIFVNLYTNIIKLDLEERKDFTPIKMARIIRDAVKQTIDSFIPTSHNDTFHRLVSDLIYSSIEGYKEGQRIGIPFKNDYVSDEDFEDIGREFDRDILPILTKMYGEYLENWLEIKRRYENRIKPRKKIVPDIKDRISQSVQSYEEKIYKHGMSVKEYAKKVSMPFSFLSGTSMANYTKYFKRQVQTGMMTPDSFAKKSYGTFFPEFYMNVAKLKKNPLREEYIRMEYALQRAEKELERQADNITGLIYSVQNVSARYKRHGPSNFDWSAYVTPVLATCNNDIGEDVDLATVTICYDKKSGVFTCHKIEDIKRLIRDNPGKIPINPITGNQFSKKVFNKFK